MKEEIKKAIAGTLAAGMIVSTTGCTTKEGKEEPIVPSTSITEVAEQQQTAEIKQVFESGTHYVVEAFTEFFPTEHWYSTATPNIPEGYTLVDYDYEPRASHNYGIYTYLYVNTVAVEVTGIYDSKTNEISFNEPGVPVEQQSLTLK